MPDMATIAAALNSLKTAADIAKFLRESDVSLERAELKLKLADLVGALADIKLELVDVQETLSEKDRRITELEQAFENKDSIVRYGDAYYAIDETGKATGIPYCLRCWENDYKKRQLVRDTKDHNTHVCTTCGHKYEGWRAQEIQAPKNQ